VTRHRHTWRLLYREGNVVKYLASGSYRVAIHATVYGCDCGKRRREKPKP